MRFVSNIYSYPEVWRWSQIPFHYWTIPLSLNWHVVSWEPEGRYCNSKMFRWETQGRYRCVYGNLAPFWFSTEHLWIAITPFWLSTDDVCAPSLSLQVQCTCITAQWYCLLRARRAITLFKDVPLRTRRALSAYHHKLCRYVRG